MSWRSSGSSLYLARIANSAYSVTYMTFIVVKDITDLEELPELLVCLPAEVLECFRVTTAVLDLPGISFAPNLPDRLDPPHLQILVDRSQVPEVATSQGGHGVATLRMLAFLTTCGDD